jgi:hypothetical protein
VSKKIIFFSMQGDILSGYKGGMPFCPSDRYVTYFGDDEEKSDNSMKHKDERSTVDRLKNLLAKHGQTIDRLDKVLVTIQDHKDSSTTSPPKKHSRATCEVTPVCQSFTDRQSFVKACEHVVDALVNKNSTVLTPENQLRILAACFTAFQLRPDLLAKYQFVALKFSSLMAVNDVLNQTLIECDHLDLERYTEQAQQTLEGHSGHPYTVVRVTFERTVFGEQSFGMHLVAQGYVIHPDEDRQAFTVGILPEKYQ